MRDERLESLLASLLLRKFVSLTPNASEIQSETDGFLSNSVHVGLQVRDSPEDVTPFVLKSPLFSFFRSEGRSERIELGR